MISPVPLQVGQLRMLFLPLPSHSKHCSVITHTSEIQVLAGQEQVALLFSRYHLRSEALQYLRNSLNRATVHCFLNCAFQPRRNRVDLDVCNTVPHLEKFGSDSLTIPGTDINIPVNRYLHFPSIVQSFPDCACIKNEYAKKGPICGNPSLREDQQLLPRSFFCRDHIEWHIFC